MATLSPLYIELFFGGGSDGSFETDDAIAVDSTPLTDSTYNYRDGLEDDSTSTYWEASGSDGEWLNARLGWQDALPSDFYEMDSISIVFEMALTSDLADDTWEARANVRQFITASTLSHLSGGEQTLWSVTGPTSGEPTPTERSATSLTLTTNAQNGDLARSSEYGWQHSHLNFSWERTNRSMGGDAIKGRIYRAWIEGTYTTKTTENASLEEPDHVTDEVDTFSQGTATDLTGTADYDAFPTGAVYVQNWTEGWADGSGEATHEDPTGATNTDPWGIIYVGQSGPADGTIGFEIGGNELDTSGHYSIWYRVQNYGSNTTFDGYRLYHSRGTNAVSLSSVSNGAGSIVGSLELGAESAYLSDGDRIAVQFIGSDHYVWINRDDANLTNAGRDWTFGGSGYGWQLLGKLTDSTHTGAGEYAITADYNSSVEAWFATFGAGSQEIVPNHIAATATVYNPTLAAEAAQDITTGTLASTASVENPTVASSTAQGITPDHISAATTVHEPTLSVPSQEITLGTLAATGAVENPTLANSAAQGITSDHIAAATTVENPTLANVAAQDITFATVGPATTVENPTLASSAVQDVTFATIGPASVVHEPTVSDTAHLVITPDHIVSTATVHEPQLIKNINLPLIAATGAVEEPTLTNVSQVVTLDHIATTGAVENPTLASSTAQDITFATIGPDTTVYGPTVSNVGVTTVTPDHIAATGGVENPTLANVAAVDVSPGFITAGTVVHEPTVSLTAHLDISPDWLNSAGTVHEPQLIKNISLPLIAATGAVHEPTVADTAHLELLPDHLAATGGVEEPTLTAVSQTITPDAIAAASVVEEPTLGAVAQDITLPLIAATGSVFDPTLTAVSQDITWTTIGPDTTVENPTLANTSQVVTPNHITAASSVYEPTVANEGVAQEITLGTITSTGSVFQPTLSAGAAQDITFAAIGPDSTVYGPTLANSAASELAPDHLADATTVYGPTLANVAQDIAPDTLGPDSAIHEPTLAASTPAEIVAGYIAAASTVHGPTLATVAALEIALDAIGPDTTVHAPLVVLASYERPTGVFESAPAATTLLEVAGAHFDTDPATPGAFLEVSGDVFDADPGRVEQ